RWLSGVVCVVCGVVCEECMCLWDACQGVAFAGLSAGRVSGGVIQLVSHVRPHTAGDARVSSQPEEGSICRSVHTPQITHRHTLAYNTVHTSRITHNLTSVT